MRWAHVGFLLALGVALPAVACGGDGDSEASQEQCAEYLAEFQRVADELGGPLAPFMVQPGEGGGMALIGIDPAAVAAREEDPDSFGMTGRIYGNYHPDVAPAIDGMIEGNCVDAYAEATRPSREASISATGQKLIAPLELGE